MNSPAEHDRRIAEEVWEKIVRRFVFGDGEKPTDIILTAITEAKKPLEEDAKIMDWLEEDPSRMDAVLAQILFPQGRSFRDACRAARAQEGKK